MGVSYGRCGPGFYRGGYGYYGNYRQRQIIVKRDDPGTIKALQKRQQELTKLFDKYENLQRQHDILLDNLATQHNKNLAHLNNIKDPKLYEQAQKQIFNEFLKGLKTFKAMYNLPKIKGYLYFAVIGEIAAGKTTIYNKILGTKEEVGVDDTTQDIAKVYHDQEKNIVYWDSPGLSQHLSITNVQCLKAFFAIDCVFIVTAVSFKNCIRAIQIMNQINPPRLYLVRNQCDKFKTDSEFQKAATKDRQLLQQYEIKNVIKILNVSMFQDDSFRDNKEFRTLMTTKF